MTLPCTLWFLDKSKVATIRKNKVLFIDARHIYTQIDRAHREFTPEDIEFIANAERAVEDFDFVERLEELNEELEVLNTEVRQLEERIAESLRFLLEQS